MNDLKKSIERAALGPVVIGEDRSVGRTFRFDDRFLGFSGHFPDFPIVPAVAQILAAQALVEACVGAPLQLRAVERAKFLLPLRPDQEVAVSCCPWDGADGLAYRVKFTVEGQPSASFMLRLQGKGAP